MDKYLLTYRQFVSIVLDFVRFDIDQFLENLVFFTTRNLTDL